MKLKRLRRLRGFTLLETVIAIGVLAVLLTGFMVVFAPAAAGIRQSLNVQEADRLASTLEQELVNLRKGDESSLTSSGGSALTGFDKAYDWISKSDKNGSAIFLYQYRGDKSAAVRSDNTPAPLEIIKDKLPGEDYVVVSMARRMGDKEFLKDLKAVEGSVYLVKCTQLKFGTTGEGLILGTPGQIVDPKGTGAAGGSASTYPEAVIAFSADFFLMPSKSDKYYSGGAFAAKFPNFKSPVFSRNLAVRR